ncbi:MAG: prolyl aminopeptidase [Nevskiales bacterium]
MRGLYPELQPYRSGQLRVSALHEIYYEECGNPQGQPALFLHGGPGAGCMPWHRRFFDPAVYRIVLFDQRGCGKSTPHACLEDNNTWQLVADMEQLRVALGIERWLLFGGSWGSTLALAYAETHPERVSALVLRGIFLLRPFELRWFYQEGCSYLFPDAWQDYLAPIPDSERDDLIAAYHRRLTSDDAATRLPAARAWSQWEAATSRLLPDAQMVQNWGESQFAEAIARVECHYFVNKGFLRSPDQLLDDVPRIRRIPGVIVQGRYDVVCPMASAWELHRRWPEAELQIVPDAGHAASEPGIVDRLVSATDGFRQSR